MTPETRIKVMHLADEYACEVANSPHQPTPLERKLATERITRARTALYEALKTSPAPGELCSACAAAEFERVSGFGSLS